mmetsp:Transcript_60139/g.117921  ORF Transcript_60139/g.117921 Transcript_60139/m.117921 type:complete len:236 (+) Transcript_60139:53-760(+)
MNLPARSKMVDPFFAMLWSENIPKLLSLPGVEVAVVAGQVDGTTPALPPAAPPDSWAAQPGSDVGIVTIKLGPGATWTLPAASSSSTNFKRCLYYFAGGTPCEVGGQSVPPNMKIDLDPTQSVELHNPSTSSAADGAVNSGIGGVGGGVAMEFLLLEGTPIGEPVVQHGPFVMNDREGIMQAFEDYQRTQFGGWPWATDAPVHDRTRPRFAKFPDGHEETPPPVPGAAMSADVDA